MIADFWIAGLGAAPGKSVGLSRAPALPRSWTETYECGGRFITAFPSASATGLPDLVGQSHCSWPRPPTFARPALARVIRPSRRI